MKIAVVYCYPMVNARIYYGLAQRFAESWKQFPPRSEHELHVIANGQNPTGLDMQPFNGMACSWHVHNNMGWDIGAYQMAADKIPCDLMVCLGAPCHFYREGWFERIVDSYLNQGPALFGSTCYGVPLHVRTTCFWFPPILLQGYPFYIGSLRTSRYDFEHGKNSFTRHTLNSRLPCVMVTFDGEFIHPNWGPHSPNHTNILVRDQHIHQ